MMLSVFAPSCFSFFNWFLKRFGELGFWEKKSFFKCSGEGKKIGFDQTLVIEIQNWGKF